MRACPAALTLVAAAPLLACAPAPVGDPRDAPTLVATKLVVLEWLKAGVPYPAALAYAIDGAGEVKVTHGCFSWSADAPRCWPVADDRAAGEARLHLTTDEPRDYVLRGSLKYLSNGHAKQSNVVAAQIFVQ